MFRLVVLPCFDVSNSFHKLISPRDARRREKVGALYSSFSGLLAVISRAYPRFLSLPDTLVREKGVPNRDVSSFRSKNVHNPAKPCPDRRGCPYFSSVRIEGASI